jgi:hypothetical protein
VLALDTLLPDLAHPPKAKLLKALQRQMFWQAQLIGTYQDAQ